MRVAVVALVLALLARTSAAEDGKRLIGILDVRGPTPESAAAFENDLETQITAEDYWIATRAKMRERLRNSTKWADGCVAGPCLAEVRVQTQAELVLLATLAGSGTTFSYVVTLVRTDTGRVWSQTSERCDVCTQQEAQTGAVLASIKLLNELPAALPDPGREHGKAVDVAVDGAVGTLERDLAAARRGPRRTGLALVAVGLVAAGVGTAMYLALEDRPIAALATATAGGGMFASGLVVLTF